MLPDSEIQRDIAELRSKISDVDARTTAKLGELEATARVTKHDLANVQQSMNGLDRRLDKLEERLGGKIDGLTDKLNGLAVKHERGAGFFAGIGFVVVGVGGVLMALARLFFGAGS